MTRLTGMATAVLLALIAASIARPIPGHAKTLSTNTEPAMTPGSDSASSTTSGGHALRSTWRAYTRRAPSPFARAVRTQSEPIRSATLERA